MKQKYYLCIDLKSFYASVECVERGLDPLTTNLVVADPERTEKTICLAVSPSLKAQGVHNRCRVFEIPKSMTYILAVPRMQLYINYAAEIYAIYLKYVSKDDIYVYSIDEAFLDVTDYMTLYRKSAAEIGYCIMKDIYDTLGIRATCGVGTNLYLTKVALDITAKHSPNYIGELDEESFRRSLWNHMPLTDFWRIGPGIATRLATYGILCPRDITTASEDLLYRLFGIDAELLIDHAWGREPVTLAQIKTYKPVNNFLSSGQILPENYSYEGGELLFKEMADQLCTDMIVKKLVTKSITLSIGYASECGYPSSHGTVSFDDPINSARLILPAVSELYRKIASPFHPIRRVGMSCNNIKPEEYYQYNFFYDMDNNEKEKKASRSIREIQNRFGKNAVLKGMNLLEGGRTRERNEQIGGHRSGTKASRKNES